MITILLADTDPKIARIVHDVEMMCHEAEISIIVHHVGEDIGEIFDSVDAKVIAFSPSGRLTLEQMFEKYMPQPACGTQRDVSMLDDGPITPERAQADELALKSRGISSKGADILLVVGGFLEGDFKSPVYAHADDTVSLGPKLLPIPEVIERIIAEYKKRAPEKPVIRFGCCG